MATILSTEIWAAVVAASVARQVHDRMAEGRGAPDDADMDRILEEAEAIADATLEARQRETLARRGRT